MNRIILLETGQLERKDKDIVTLNTLKLHFMACAYHV